MGNSKWEKTKESKDKEIDKEDSEMMIFVLVRLGLIS